MLSVGELYILTYCLWEWAPCDISRKIISETPMGGWHIVGIFFFLWNQTLEFLKFHFPLPPQGRSIAVDSAELEWVSVHSFCSMLKPPPVPHEASPTSIPDWSPPARPCRIHRTTWLWMERGQEQSQKTQRAKRATGHEN